MKVATRSSGTPPLPPGGRHKSRRLGNSGKRVARRAAPLDDADTDDAAPVDAAAPVEDEDDEVLGIIGLEDVDGGICCKKKTPKMKI